MARKNRLPEPTGIDVTCKICGETKDEHLFKYQHGKRCGYKCRACDLSEKQKLYAENEVVREAAKLRSKLAPLKKPEQYKAAKKQYREENREELSAKKRIYSADHREENRVRCKEWYYDNKDTDKFKQKAKDYLDKTVEQRRLSYRKYYESNKDKFKQAGIQRRKDKPWMNTFYTRRYNLGRDKRTPAWASQEAISWFYENCPKGFAVDHIIPLNGKLVSGLHIESNLQFLSRSTNASKSNKFYPDLFDADYTPSGWCLGNWDGKTCNMPPEEHLEDYMSRGWHPLFEDTQEYVGACNSEQNGEYVWYTEIC